MPMEALQHPSRQPLKAAVGVSPPRLRPKGPLGPDFYRRVQSGASTPRQSAVERLEADKAKYVKSQVALSKQQPVRAPELKKPLLNPSTPLRPTRRTPAQPSPKPEGVQLDLERLSSLISDLPNGPQCAAKPPAPQVKAKPRPPPRPDWPRAATVRLKATTPATADGPVCPGAPAAGTVRRVDVMPQAGQVRPGSRPPQYVRQPLQPVPVHPQFPLHPTTSRQGLLVQKTMATVAPKPEPLAPASPAITRLSSSSSRKRPSLTRSKSDMSDRFSRAGTELERFFNLCGLEPVDLQDLPASSSDIVSLARFRSVSAPGSECGASQRGGVEEEEEEAPNPADRVPYGVSVIERNARVIKWLYGLRQAKENTTKSTNL
ncbi:protein FAM110A [Xiphophorus couchianus]|uniref:protein FAM110A n=1 Tax=Xiphophorus couchianus TaxID=32473 RepID=UPI00101690A6|nr:protein FAM110A-like [Xiphophorus couchianus]